MINLNRFLTFIFIACSLCNETHADIYTLPEELKDLTIESYPVTDGSISTSPLRRLLACKLLNIDYYWQRDYLAPPEQGLKNLYYDFLSETGKYLTENKILNNNTHPSFINLIDNKVELIITARDISRDEKSYADSRHASIISKPIAQDALTFIVSPKNTIKNLSQQQIRDIYMQKIKYWHEVGGPNYPITPYIRNDNSGSQEKFETMVMAGLSMPPFQELQIGKTMESPYIQLKNDITGISFTPYYYYNVMVDNDDTKAIGIDGVEMTTEHIIDNTYPYITEIYACVNANIDKSSLAYRLYNFLTTSKGQDIVEESGYIPKYQTSGINLISNQLCAYTQNKMLHISADLKVDIVRIYDLNGIEKFFIKNPENVINLNQLPAGIYIGSFKLASGQTTFTKINLYSN